MEIDANLVTVIIAVIALVSPIITTLINNHYQSKRENMQNFELAKRQALINFIKSANDFHHFASGHISSDYYANLANLYIYFPSVPDKIHSLEKPHNADFEKDLELIVEELSKQLAKK